MRTLVLFCSAVAMATGLATGCGGGTTTSPTPDPGVSAAKRDLLVTYRVANEARIHGLRCSTSPSPSCQHPDWYPHDGVLVADVGSKLLRRLPVALAGSTGQVTRPGVTYILADGTRRQSVVLAQRTNDGTILVLHGSPPGSRFSETKAATYARNQRADRPPISSSYPPSNLCGRLHFDKPPRNADEIRVAGGNCDQAEALVRRTHEQCTHSVCDTGDYRCDEGNPATGVLSVYCRNRETKITWTSSGFD
jgi:hypothetical protein